MLRDCLGVAAFGWAHLSACLGHASARATLQAKAAAWLCELYACLSEQRRLHAGALPADKLRAWPLFRAMAQQGAAQVSLADGHKLRIWDPRWVWVQGLGAEQTHGKRARNTAPQLACMH